MHKLLQSATRHRRGIAALAFGVMLPLFLGFAALSIDLGVLAVARGQLSTAADAGALAGAMQLADELHYYGITDTATVINAASAQATQYVQANSVLNQSAVVVANTANSTSGDIVVGYVPLTNLTAAIDTSTANASNFNTVQVTTYRDKSHGGVVPGFFSRLMGFQGSSPSVMSRAIAQNYSISGFQGTSYSPNVNLLPIVLDVVTQQAMLKGVTIDNMPMADQYTWNPATKTVTSGSDGVWESVLYPVASGSPGNWGTINVGVSNNSTSTISDQIRNGITPAQLATFPNSTIALDSTQSPPQITFSGNPGISAGIKDDLTSIIGKPVIIPIYDNNGSQGNNAWYRVIAFQGARILDVNFQGNPKYVIIQPAVVKDPTAVRGSPNPSWAQGGIIGVHLIQNSK